MITTHQSLVKYYEFVYISAVRLGGELECANQATLRTGPRCSVSGFQIFSPAKQSTLSRSSGKESYLSFITFLPPLVPFSLFRSLLQVLKIE